MPTAPLRRCLDCYRLIPSGTSRCAEHARQHRHAANTRGLHHLYRTARWARVKAYFRAEQPLCVACEAEGHIRPWDQLDHIIPHGGDLELFWDLDNLQGLCATHHSAKTRRGQ